MESAVNRAWEQTLFPALEKETLDSLSERAESAAIEVCCRNLKKQLMEAALGGKRVLAIDPGHKDGGTVAVIDKKGHLLEHASIRLGES